jgi:hypothetical protein
VSKTVYPTIPVTHPDFVYTSAVNTDVRITWRKARKVNNLLDKYREPKHEQI